MSHSNLINIKMESKGMESPKQLNTTDKTTTCPNDAKPNKH